MSVKKEIIKIKQNDLIRILKDNYKNESDTRFVFLLGAGASVQSEIPSAKDLAKEWLEEIKEDLSSEYKDWKNKNNIDESEPSSKYTEIFRKRFEYNPQNGYETLQKIMEDKQPSIGYTILSQILENTNHNFVITTNFDSLIEDALFLFTSKRPLVCGHESLANFVQLNSTRPTIIKAHRDILLNPYNTPDNTCELEEQLENALKPILANSPLVIISYGGNDESIMSFLKSSQRQEIYWCLRKVEDVPSNILDVLKENDKVVKIDGFDELMVSLQSNVYKFKSIESLANDEDEKSLIVENAYKKVAIYKEQLEKFRKEVEDSNSTDFKENSKSILPSWWEYQLKINETEDYEMKFNIYKEGLKAHPKSFEILCNWGIEIGNLAFIKKDENLFKQAFKKYEEASMLNSTSDIILLNWGTDLGRLAAIKKDENLFNHAFEKFEKASKLNPDDYKVFSNWASSLLRLANVKKNNLDILNKASEIIDKSIKLGASSYNLACFYSLQNKKEEALQILDQNLKNNDISREHVLEDEDWSNLLNDKDFLNVISKYQYKTE